jgi:hypothetical protein
VIAPLEWGLPDVKEEKIYRKLPSKSCSVNGRLLNPGSMGASSSTTLGSIIHGLQIKKKRKNNEQIEDKEVD